MEVVVQHIRTDKLIASFKNVNLDLTIYDIKKMIQKERRKFDPSRQSLKLSKTGKPLADEQLLKDFEPAVGKSLVLYFKDLGLQIGWSTVFLAEYAGPLAIYLLVYYQRKWFYTVDKYNYLPIQTIAMICWSGHYTKRLLETIFVHRFSHQTMPLMNLVKNCSYYWGFTLFVAYFNNHNLYTQAVYGPAQIYLGLFLFVLSEFGNLSIHVALKNLRPADSKVRKIPYPTSNPFTGLFNYVSCPNYTYESLAWLGYSIMSQSVPALLFTACGFTQMSIWALGKHRNYRKEFPDYPKSRKAIVPFVL